MRAYRHVQFEASLLGRGPLSRSFFSRVKMHPPAGEVSRQPTLAPNLAPGHGPSDNSVLVSHYNTTYGGPMGVPPAHTGEISFLLRPPFFPPPKFHVQKGVHFVRSTTRVAAFPLLVHLVRKNARGGLLQIDRY